MSVVPTTMNDPSIYQCIDKFDSNSRFCTCSFHASFNFLECTNSSIEQIPDDLASQYKWDYVSFGSGGDGQGANTKNNLALRTNSFQRLSLKANATIVVTNLVELGSDIFSQSLITDGQFRFVIQNSILFSLGRNLAFRGANLSQIEFKDSNLDEISVGAFDGAIIEKFIINGANPQSLSPFFKVRFSFICSYLF